MEPVIDWVFVCLSLCLKHYSKSSEWIVMKVYGRACGGKRNNALHEKVALYSILQNILTSTVMIFPASYQ